MIKQTPEKWGAGAGGTLWERANWRVVFFWSIINQAEQLYPGFLVQQENWVKSLDY